MAEVRKHNPDEADGLGKLVRDALGERVRPIEPGRGRGDAKDEETQGRDEATGPSVSSLPSWPSDSAGFTF